MITDGILQISSYDLLTIIFGLGCLTARGIILSRVNFLELTHPLHNFVRKMFVRCFENTILDLQMRAVDRVYYPTGSMGAKHPPPISLSKTG
jgi:hypothetical protein